MLPPGHDVSSAAERTDIYPTALAIMLKLIYAVGAVSASPPQRGA